MRDFTLGAVERLQKKLAADLGGDLAATSVTQLTRLPGFSNHKYDEPYVVWVDYRDVEYVYAPRDFPRVGDAEPGRPERVVAERSLIGYLSTMPEERFLVAYLHELLTTLNHRNVVTIVTLAQHGLVGENVAAPIDVSYLADTVLLLRYFEAFGHIRRAISVLKKRGGPHEVAVREMRIEKGGIAVGEPITDFQGVLTGRPHFTGTSSQLDAQG